MDYSGKIMVLPLVVMLLVAFGASKVFSLQSPPIGIASQGTIIYGQPTGLRGTSWFGLDITADPRENYKMTKDYFDFMIETFPNMNFLSLPCAAITIMPNVGTGDYTTINTDRLNLLKDFISWCKPLGIKVLISNYWQNVFATAGIIAYWEFMANEFLGEDTVVGFDLINEPWGKVSNNAERQQVWDSYRDIIDAIRAIDPTRTVYVQSVYDHEDGSLWRSLLQSSPVNRDNVVYISHLYSNHWSTGAWYDPWTAPWSDEYQAGDYVAGKQVLLDQDITSSLYDRFGFIKQELGFPVAITEIAFISSAEGLKWGEDVLDVLNQWGIDWTYHCWYTNVDRPMSLTYPDGTLRPQSTTVQNNI